MTPPNTARRAGIPAAAWFAGASFHGSAAHRPAPAPTATAPAADTRPRRDYVLPSGELVTFIADHGDPIRPMITYALAGGRIVHAVLSPIRRVEIEALHAYALRPEAYSPRVRYLAEDALGIMRPGSSPLTGAERCAAIRSCADELQMLRAMGAQLEVRS